MIKHTSSQVHEQARHLPVRACMLAYLAATRSGRNPASQRLTTGRLLVFSDWCDLQDIGVEQVSARLVADFIEHLSATHKARKRGETVMSSVTIAGYVQCIKSALLWASGDELVYAEYVNEKVIKRIARPRLDAGSAYLMIRQGKGRKDRRVPMSETTRRRLEDFMLTWRADIPPASPVITSRDGTESFTVAGLQQLLKRLARRAGISDMRVSPHNFRHTFSANALRAGMDIYMLQRVLGHSSTSITEHYIKSLGADFDLHDRAVKFMP